MAKQVKKSKSGDTNEFITGRDINTTVAGEKGKRLYRLVTLSPGSGNTRLEFRQESTSCPLKPELIALPV